MHNGGYRVMRLLSALQEGALPDIGPEIALLNDLLIRSDRYRVDLDNGAVSVSLSSLVASCRRSRSTILRYRAALRRAGHLRVNYSQSHARAAQYRLGAEVLGLVPMSPTVGASSGMSRAVAGGGPPVVQGGAHNGPLQSLRAPGHKSGSSPGPLHATGPEEIPDEFLRLGPDPEGGVGNGLGRETVAAWHRLATAGSGDSPRIVAPAAKHRRLYAELMTSLERLPVGALSPVCRAAEAAIHDARTRSGPLDNLAQIKRQLRIAMAHDITSKPAPVVVPDHNAANPAEYDPRQDPACDTGYSWTRSSGCGSRTARAPHAPPTASPPGPDMSHEELLALCHELGHEVEPHVPTEHLASLAQIDAR